MANDPVMNIAGNTNPDMMGSHGGDGFPTVMGSPWL